jgi:hypothetical protein
VRHARASRSSPDRTSWPLRGRLRDLPEGEACTGAGLQGFEVWKEPLLRCLGMPTCAGGVFCEAERLKLAAISEGVCPSWQLPRHRAKYHWKLSVDTPNKVVLEQMLGTRG